MPKRTEEKDLEVEERADKVENSDDWIEDEELGDIE